MPYVTSNITYASFLLISNAFSKLTFDCSTTTTTTKSSSGETTAPFFALSAYAFKTSALEQSDGYTILCTSSEKNIRRSGRTEDVQQQDEEQQRQREGQPEEAAADGGGVVGVGEDVGEDSSTREDRGREDEEQDEDGKEKAEEEEEVHSQKKINFLLWEIGNQ